MAEQFQWLYQTKIVTNSGPVYLLKRKTTDQKFFGYENKKNKDHQNVFSIENEIQQELVAQNHFRSYQELIVTNDYNYYLFTYLEGNTIGELIADFKMQKKRVPLEQIKNYVYQLVKSLYFLHTKGILGRVFSVDNIIDKNGQLYLMDFGYHSDLKNINSAILASPETVQEQSYDIKIDIWLLGVFIFNLIKLQPITKLKYSQIEQYKMNLKQFETSIKCNSTQYSESLTNLVERMLTLKSMNRITFVQLLNHEFFSDMQEREAMITFYGQIQNVEEKFQIYIRRRDFPSVIQDTSELQSPIDVHFLLPYFYSDFQDNFCQIWNYIYFEEYKIYLLDNTANLLDKNLVCQVKSLAMYRIQKMQLLHVNQLLQYLDTKHNQWNVELWDQFKQKQQFTELKVSLISSREYIIKKLKLLCHQLLDNQQLMPLTIGECQKDELNKFEFDIKVEYYREIFEQTMQSIREKINICRQEQNQSQSMCLKIFYKCLICQLITKLKQNNIEFHFPELEICNLENLHSFIEYGCSLNYQESMRYLIRLYSDDSNEYD